MTINSQDHAASGPDDGPPPSLLERAFETLEGNGVFTTTRVWSPGRQASFLAAIAEGASVAQAAERVGVVERTAYSFRRRVQGEMFDIGWRAACLLARDKLHDALYDRALNGQTLQDERDDGERVVSVTRHRFDNRLSLAVLARLDRLAEEPGSEQDVARLIAANFDHYLARITADTEPETIVAYLRGRATVQPFDIMATPEAQDDDDDGDQIHDAKDS